MSAFLLRWGFYHEYLYNPYFKENLSVILGKSIPA
jgi:hypothetical protein